MPFISESRYIIFIIARSMCLNVSQQKHAELAVCEKYSDEIDLLYPDGRAEYVIFPNRFGGFIKETDRGDTYIDKTRWKLEEIKRRVLDHNEQSADVVRVIYNYSDWETLAPDDIADMEKAREMFPAVPTPAEIFRVLYLDGDLIEDRWRAFADACYARATYNMEREQEIIQETSRTPRRTRRY